MSKSVHLACLVFCAWTCVVIVYCLDIWDCGCQWSLTFLLGAAIVRDQTRAISESQMRVSGIAIERMNTNVVLELIIIHT